MSILVYISICTASLLVGRVACRISKGASLVIMAFLVSWFSVWVGVQGVHKFDRIIYALHYETYYSLFDDNIGAVLYDNFQQIGWAIYNILIRFFTKDPECFMQVTTFFYMLSSFYCFRKIRNYDFFLLCVIFFITLCPLFSVNQYRQFFAMAFCNIAFIFYIKRDLFKVFVMVSISLFIHSSSIVFILFLLFDYGINKIFNKNGYVLVLAACLFIVPVSEIILWLVPYVRNTISTGVENNGFNFLVILKCIPNMILSVAMILFKDKIRKHVNIFNTLLHANIMMSFLWIFSCYMYWFWRLSFYFMIPFVISFVVLMMHKNKTMTMLCFISIIAQSLITLREIFITLG